MGPRIPLAEVRARAERAIAALACCRACPRACEVDRLSGLADVCSTGRHARVSSFFAHHGEEDCLRGWRGSGTIFFSSCNLKCVFCQNHDTSQGAVGEEVTAPELAGMMLALQRAGCHNVNLVTPEHVVPQVLEALPIALQAGLSIPIVYNTSAYDSLDSLRALEGLVDVYMPDFKLWTPSLAARYLKAKDYPEVARRAIAEMHRQVGPLEIDEQGVARRGVLLRHLVMPALLDETAAILRWIATDLSKDTWVNLMAQYRPEHRAAEHPEIDRRPTTDELREAHRHFRACGLSRLDERHEVPSRYLRL